MIQAVLFDLDGVLVSTDEYHYHSWKRLSAEEGFDFFDHEFNHKFRGVARMECVEIITKASGKHTPPSRNKNSQIGKTGILPSLF